MRIALVPLDDRPVNTSMVADIAHIAGATVLLPPRRSLPHFRDPGDTDALAAWLVEASGAGIDGAVVSLDMLGYGGLIASRTSHETTREILGRISVLEDIHREHPSLPLGAINVFLRASNSNNASEEPAYWREYGLLLHRLGGRAHEAWLQESAGGPPAVVDPLIPAVVRQDFARRRLRNHIVNLAGLDLASTGTVSTLLLTADDTAPRSAGSAEQTLIDYWRILLGPREDVLIYPGADEVAAVMTARLLSQHHGVSPSFAVTCVEPDGLDRIAPYENTPLGTGVQRQVLAAGGRLVADTPDTRLVVHAPSPTGGDFYGGTPEPTGQGLIKRTVEEIESALEAGEHVALADCRFPNGGDPGLVEALRDRGVLLLLDAYGGWNTAGNALGSTVAAAAVATIGRRTGTLDPDAQQKFLLSRLVEDYGYQSRVRAEVVGDTSAQDHLRPASVDVAADQVADRLDLVLQELLGAGSGWRVGGVSFPWARAFEISLRLDHSAGSAPRCRKDPA